MDGSGLEKSSGLGLWARWIEALPVEASAGQRQGQGQVLGSNHNARKKRGSAHCYSAERCSPKLPSGIPIFKNAEGPCQPRHHNRLLESKLQLRVRARGTMRQGNRARVRQEAAEE